MTEEEFETKTVAEIQDIMREKHIVVTHMRSGQLQFDARGLSTLTGLSTIADIQGTHLFLQ